ncbi:MAG: hypothetical protein JST20_08935 [Bacteroidetes bacterium]|nr:hypothetical protein [Bacteroidota bacterium]
MIKATNIFLLIFYLFGTLCLPKGDFSALKDLPEMYRHCKYNEDKDMTPLDFITDHVINVDGIFDKHDNGDRQKPHRQIPALHHSQIIVYQPAISYILTKNLTIVVRTKDSFCSDNFTQSEYTSKIFHPPKI